MGNKPTVRTATLLTCMGLTLVAVACVGRASRFGLGEASELPGQPGASMGDPAGASAEPGQEGPTLFVSPARIEFDLPEQSRGPGEATARPGAQVPLTLVCVPGVRAGALGWLGAIDVSIYAGMGGHDLQGTPIPDDSPEARAVAERLVEVSPRRLTLRAGQARQVTARFHRPEGFSGGLYPIIFVEWRPRPANPGTPPGKSHEQAGGLTSVSRLGIVCLIGSSDAASFRPAVAEVRATQGAPPCVEWVVENRGTSHGGLVGYVVTVVDRKPGGDAADLTRDRSESRTPCATGTILPGRARVVRVPLAFERNRRVRLVATLTLWRAAPASGGKADEAAPSGGAVADRPSSGSDSRGAPEITSSVALEIATSGSVRLLPQE